MRGRRRAWIRSPDLALAQIRRAAKRLWGVLNSASGGCDAGDDVLVEVKKMRPKLV